MFSRHSEIGEGKRLQANTKVVTQFLESFANKHVSSSEDRLEETKRRKLARKCEKLVELMMVSGIPTASGYEERIQFSEIEVVDRGANEQGLLANMPEGHAIFGWDVNVAGVRVSYTRRTVRHHQHAVCLPNRGESMNDSLTIIGIHYPRPSRGPAGSLHREEIWRFRQAPQATPGRTTRQTATRSSPEEQVVNFVEFLWLRGSR